MDWPRDLARLWRQTWAKLCRLCAAASSLEKLKAHGGQLRTARITPQWYGAQCEGKKEFLSVLPIYVNVRKKFR